MSPVGENIKKIRKQVNMTQSDLAKKLFITRQTVSNWESGKSCPDVASVKEIAKVLNVDVSNLLDKEDKSVQPIDNLLHTKIQKVIEITSVQRKKNTYQLLNFVILTTAYVCVEIFAAVFVKPIAAAKGYISYYYFCSLIRPLVIVMLTLYIGYLIREVLGMRKINHILKKICFITSAFILGLFCFVMISGVFPLTMPSVLLFYAYEIGTLGFPFIFVGVLLFFGVASPKCNAEKYLSDINNIEICL